tara:strand:+ start:3071 stop:4030 length:960 start_codon:yes stop_codon:yes gene_type:complete
MTHLARSIKILLLFLACLDIKNSVADSPLRIVGSSAMYPFLTSVSERYGYEKNTTAPIIEATGTGGGIKFFCSGINARSPSLVAASRRMTPKEIAYCKKRGVHAIFELPLGIDGIVLVAGKNQSIPLLNLSLKDLLKAVIDFSCLKKSEPYQFWSEINPDLPEMPIKILVPSTSSGTREAFENLVLGGKRARQDRSFKSAADQEAVLVQKLLKANEAIGVLSYAYLEKNRNILRPVAINGVFPSRTSIRTKAYPLVRKVYIYAKGEHLSKHPLLSSFMKYLVSPQTKNLLNENGLIPLSEDSDVRRQKKMSLFMGNLAK